MKPNKNTKEERIKAWAILDKGKLSHYYNLAFITYTKKQAKIEAKYYNSIPYKKDSPLKHKMTVAPCEIIIKKKK